MRLGFVGAGLFSGLHSYALAPDLLGKVGRAGGTRRFEKGIFFGASLTGSLRSHSYRVSETVRLLPAGRMIPA